MKANAKQVEIIVERALRSALADVWNALITDPSFEEEARRLIESGVSTPMVEHRIKAKCTDRLGLTDSTVIAMRKRG